MVSKTMPNPPRKIAFMLAATDHGAMIVNRLDYRMLAPDKGYGVGYQLLETASFDRSEVELMLSLLDMRRKYYGDGVVAVDRGANIGVHTIEWAKRMTGWGSVIALEAQERIYYALAGNIAINNCFNAQAIHAAAAAQQGMMKMPCPDYLKAASFGSLELRKREKTEFIGQDIDYAGGKMVEIRTQSIDAMTMARLDMIKIDVEGMELEVLEGAIKSVSDHRPIILVESVKTDKERLRSWLVDRNYSVFATGLNFLAVHAADKCLGHFKKGTP